jgi:hypothetical protein
MHGNKKYPRMAFFKMRPPELFRVDPSLSLPQKVKKITANWKSIYGATLPQAWKFFIIYIYS